MKRPVVSLPWKRVALAEVMEMRALRAGIFVDLFGETNLRLEEVTLKVPVDMQEKRRWFFAFDADTLNALEGAV
jgi:hypothetical protein